MAKKSTQFPWQHVIGFLLSIVLTLAALWAALYAGFSMTMIIVIIVGLAIVQAIIQLLMFMHMTESSNGRHQTHIMLHSAFIAVVLVVGTLWVVSYGFH
ncbi:cytochrome aa3 quinol oxidase subunit IV [Pseudalkalibacillus sp. SCS-8]|uniref:cytochrome aa3 quinol oxidase subunit IV n=1 Tax=Pseudalkalibacillus nanhaiensis TaxID=3115291 RepID=UPI0032DB4CCB